MMLKNQSSKKDIIRIINDFKTPETITAYEAYTYMLINDITIFGKYNELFRTDFKVEYEILTNRHLEHLKTSKVEK